MDKKLQKAVYSFTLYVWQISMSGEGWIRWLPRVLWCQAMAEMLQGEGIQVGMCILWGKWRWGKGECMELTEL